MARLTIVCVATFFLSFLISFSFDVKDMFKLSHTPSQKKQILCWIEQTFLLQDNLQSFFLKQIFLEFWFSFFFFWKLK